jgi:hypothetical protein
MLAQEAWQRSGRHRPEQPAHRFVAGGAVPRKHLGRRLSCLEILRSGITRENNDHKHRR